MHRVTILMSTYNGERFLPAQLDSIFSQEGVNVALLVRDDGSNDNTLSILSDYQKRYPDKIEIIKGQNIGWKESFRKLVEHALTNYQDCDYFAFGDQDDIWLPGKLRAAIDTIRKYPEGPKLYFSNLFFYKGGENKGKIHKYQFKPTYKNALTRNFATGCSIVFNSRLLKLLHQGTPAMEMPHDYWVYMVAVLCGQAIYDSESYILYRQHESNQIGSRHGLLDVWKRRITHLTENSGLREKIANELLRLYSPYMHPEALVATKKMACYRSSFLSRLRLLFDSDYTFGNMGNDFFFKLRIILGNL